MTATPCEISWFSALCDDDYEFLGVPDPMLRSTWEHCRDIVLQAESGGFDNILLPSGYALGIDTTAFRGGDRNAGEADPAAHGGAHRRDLAAAARPPDRDHRSHPGRRLTVNNHLLRHAGRDARLRAALRPDVRGDVDPENIVELASRSTTRASSGS
jgi:hypothetical protein